MKPSKRAFITGINGQDGSYLAEYLLAKGYVVHGLVHSRANKTDDELWRLAAIRDRITLHHGHIEDPKGLANLVSSIKPEEFYHLAASSFAATSNEDDGDLINTNVNGTHHAIAAVHRYAPQCRFFFAGSAEMFGKAAITPQDETTAFNPRSIYGVTKVMGHTLIQYFRERYGLFACTGFLYNHESPRRSHRFVTRKITLAAARIKLGLDEELRLGNLETLRDWGFAGDYVIAMHAMLSAKNPDDYVIATGKNHTVKEFLTRAFEELDLDYRKYVVTDQEFIRPSETVPLKGNASRARTKLGWEPSIEFDMLVRNMVRSDLEFLKRGPRRPET